MKKSLLALILLILALAITILIDANINKDKAQSKKPQIITNFLLETPDIKDKNLAQFYLWTKEDPLFASPDFNPDLFLEVVKVLEDEEKKYLQENGLKDKIFPDSFLEEIVSVNKLNKKFLENPSRSNAEELISEYKKTVSAYEMSRDTLLKKINTYNPKPPKDTFPTLAVQTTLKIIKGNLAMLEKNYFEFKNEISKRQLCLEKGSGCKRPVNDFTNFKINKTDYTFSKNEILPIGLISAPDIKNKIWNGPYAVNTPCFGWGDNFTQPTHLFFVVHGKEIKNFSENQTELLTTEVKLATTIYYNKIVDNGSPEMELYGNINKENVLLGSHTNIYNCADYSYVPRLSSVDKFYTEYKYKQIFQNLLKLSNLPDAIKSTLKEGSALEGAFFKSEFPSENDAQNLANYYGLLYQKSILWVNNSQYNSQNWAKQIFKNRDSYLNRYLEYSRHLSNINEILAQADGNFSLLRISTLMYPSVSDDYYIYAYRNMYGLVYFPFSRSFYRLSSQLTYLDKIRINRRHSFEGIFTYQEAIKRYSIDQIKSWDVDRSLVLQKIYNKYQLEHQKN